MPRGWQRGMEKGSAGREWDRPDLVLRAAFWRGRSQNHAVINRKYSVSMANKDPAPQPPDVVRSIEETASAQGDTVPKQTP